MKELSIEEKAEAYDAVIERARKVLLDCTPEERHVVEYISPELTESEDEKIRKMLIEFFSKGAEYNSSTNGISDKDIIAWLEKQDSQNLANSTKTCNIEPKFHKGEWVTNGIETVQITGYDIDYGYQVDYNGNLQHRDTDVIEKEYHLWTIEDAKTGDVLIDDIGVILFRKIGNEKYENAVDYHCVVYTDGKFEKQEGLSYWGLSTYAVLHPATKVQRERFFARMKESGYEWDAERLELKKVDNEIEIPFGAKDSELQEVTYFIPKGFHAEIDDDKVVIKKGAKPTDWSEEDENYYQGCLKAMKTYGGNDTPISKWIESIKNRVQPQPQPKQEWNDEDEKEVAVLEAYICSKDWSERHIDRALGIVDELVNKAKSIKSQPKQEWSEEDEKIVAGLNNCIDELEEVNGWRFTYVNDENVELCKIRNWLKFLKDRVGCEANCTTTKQWSREDEIMLKVFDSIIRYIVVVVDKEVFERFGTNSEELFSWIKSIKDRYTWKPSDEQMKQLCWVAKQNKNNMLGKELMTLYQDLKKL